MNTYRVWIIGISKRNAKIFKAENTKDLYEQVTKKYGKNICYKWRYK